MSDQKKSERKGRGRRRLVIAAGVVLIVAGLAIALAPTIASSLAPGKIESAVNADIKGRVKVGKANIGWFTPLEVGRVEVFDEGGQLAAWVEARAPVTVWQVLTGRWWSASRIDVGTIEASGLLDLKQYKDGSTNLQRAFATKSGAAAGGGKGAGSASPSTKSDQPPAVKATLKLLNIDATVRKEDDGFKEAIGVKGLKGDVSVDADMGAGMVKASADLTGAAVAPGPAGAGSAGGGGAVTVKLDADVKTAPAAGGAGLGDIERAKIKLAVVNAPVAVADAVAALGGALVEGVGSTANIVVDVDGNASALAGLVKVESAGLTTDAKFALKDGVLRGEGEKPVAVNLRSTAFLEQLPQTRASVASAKEKIRLTAAPSIELTLEKLSVPMPKSGAALGDVDWRGANVGVRVKVSELSGQVAIAEASGPGAEGTAAAWKPFVVEPVELAVSIDDLSKPVRIATGTTASLDGKAAGDIRLSLDAEGLLDSSGRVRALRKDAGFADKAEARADIKGVSTALLAPVTAGLGLPLDMNADVGPTLDVNVLARADVKGLTGAPAGGGLISLPPSDVTATVRSANLNADVEARLDKGLLTTGEKGIRLTVASAAPLAQRIMSAGASADKPAAVAIGGRGSVEAVIKDVSISLADPAPERLLKDGRATATVTVSDLIVTPDMGGERAPVRVDTLSAAGVLAPGAAPKITLNSGMSHGGSPFGIEGDITLAGLRNGAPKGTGPGALVELNPTGTIAVKKLPRSALWIVGSLNDKFGESGKSATADEMSRAIAAAVRGAIGADVTATVKMMPAGADKGGGQFANVKVETAGKGVSADVWTRVAAAEAELSSAVLIAELNAAALDPVLASLNKPVAAAPGATPPPATPPMKIGSPSKLYIEVKQPAKIPLVTDASGAVAPDWSKAGDAKVEIALAGDAVVEGVVLEDKRSTGGALRTATVALRGLKGSVVAPLAGLDPKLAASKRATVKLNADALDKTSGEKKIAALSVDAGATMTGDNPEGEIVLAGLSTAHAEGLIGQQGLLTGALGDTAEVRVKAKPQQGTARAVDIQMTSPRVSGADIGLAMDDVKVYLTKPSTITWTPDAAFINKYLLGGAEASVSGPSTPQQPARPRRRARAGESTTPPAAASGPALSLREASPITIKIDRLSVAKASNKEGSPAVGPLKAGVFELGLSASTPSLTMLTAGASGGANGPGGGPAPMTIEGLTIDAKSIPGATAGVEVNLNFAKVSGAGADAGRASSAKATITNLADAAGVIDTDKAVVNADVDVAAFPTPIVDQLAKKNGLLTELLGPTVSLRATAQNLSKGAGTASGTLDATATSPRATAKLKGDLREGVFVQSGPVDVRLMEIRPQLVDALAGGLPLIESLEKTPPDAPATVVTERLTVPLDDDMRRLNGKVTVSPGVARFSTGNVFGKILKEVGGKDSGTVGKKIEPFVVNIDKGVATYDRFSLPFGEFTLDTRGTVDLVKNEINVVTYAPFFALAEEAVGKLRVGIPGGIEIIDKATMVPITTKGSMDNPKTELDIGLFIKELGDKILKAPGDILKEPGKILDNLLNPNKDKVPSPDTPAAPAPKQADPQPTPPKPSEPKPDPKQPEPKKPAPKKPDPKPPAANPPAPPSNPPPTTPPTTDPPKDKPKPKKKKDEKPEQPPK
ncbi:MAG: hypothetical protein IT438_17080 [Phycisphaerales bacterium]|nr:hypothetical protein [Phycisphaerales bacterium]